MQELIAVSILAVLLGGLTKGITGFGYAVTGTALLASFIPARTAVVLMLPALIATNIEIACEKGFSEVWARITEFKYFALTLMIGSIAGTLLIDFLPQQVIAKGVGLLVMTYIIFKQEIIELTFTEHFKNFCLRQAHSYQGILGLGSGLIFGSSNIGVPIVAISDRIEDNHGDFMSLLSGLMIMSITARFLIAYATGLYQLRGIIVAAALVAPGIAGLKAGEILRKHLKNETIGRIVLILLGIIAVKLVLF